jgi:hypothetical protein
MRLRRRTLLELSAGTSVALSASALFAEPAMACDDDPSFTGLDPSSGLQVTLRISKLRAERFEGTFRSPQLGTLTLSHTGTDVLGRFQYARAGARVSGALEGRAHGNLLRFSFREAHRGPEGEVLVRGEGFFLFDPPQGDQTRVRLFGARHHRMLEQAERPGLFRFASRSAGPVMATRLSEGAG